MPNWASMNCVMDSTSIFNLCAIWAKLTPIAKYHYSKYVLKTFTKTKEILMHRIEKTFTNQIGLEYNPVLIGFNVSY